MRLCETFEEYWRELLRKNLKHNSPEQLNFAVCDMADDARRLALFCRDLSRLEVFVQPRKLDMIADLVEIADALQVEGR